MLAMPYTSFLVWINVQCLSSLLLNWLIVDELTTASGKLFHIFTILSVK